MQFFNKNFFRFSLGFVAIVSATLLLIFIIGSRAS